MTVRIPSRRHRIGLAVLLAGVFALSGCSVSDDPLAPDLTFTQDDADDAAVQASISLSGLQSTLGATSSAGVSTTADTTWTQGNLTYRLTRRWFDESGVEQALPTATTDSIHVTTRVTGSDSTARWVGTIGHSGQLGVGALSPARPTLWIDGSRADTLDVRFTTVGGSATRWFDARTLTTVEDVRWTKPADSSTTTYPSAGTITMGIAARRFTDASHATVERTFDATVVVTFNGTRFAHATINGTFHYLIDLETGAVSRDVH
jgi:uncharacterized protein YcfL